MNGRRRCRITEKVRTGAYTTRFHPSFVTGQFTVFARTFSEAATLAAQISNAQLDLDCFLQVVEPYGELREIQYRRARDYLWSRRGMNPIERNRALYHIDSALESIRMQGRVV